MKTTLPEDKKFGQRFTHNDANAVKAAITELDGNISNINSLNLWIPKNAVATKAALVTTYPTPAKNWAAMALDDGYIYVNDGLGALEVNWVNSGQKQFPVDVVVQSEAKLMKSSAAYKAKRTLQISGESLSGAINIANGFKIPIGQTGTSSYLSCNVPIISNINGIVLINLTTNINITFFQTFVDFFAIGSTVEVIANGSNNYTIVVSFIKAGTSALVSMQMGDHGTYTEEKQFVINEIHYCSYDELKKVGISTILIDEAINNSYVASKSYTDSKISDIKANEFVYKEIQITNPTGASLSGAVDIANGFKIPIGQTGASSYRNCLTNIISGLIGVCEINVTTNIPIGYFDKFVDFYAIGSTVEVIDNGLNNYTILVSFIKAGTSALVSMQMGDHGTYTEEKQFVINSVKYYSKSIKNQLDGSQILIDKRLSEIKQETTHTITCAVSGTVGVDADFIGVNCIQDAIDSITDATKDKRYTIYIKNGYYFVTNSSQYKGYLGYPSMICMKDYISLMGETMNGVVIHAELPYNDADIDISIDGLAHERIQHQTMYNFAVDGNVRNLTLVGKNLRYTIHMDNGNAANSQRIYENVIVIFEGDKGYLRAFGLGTTTGEINVLKNVKIYSSGTTFSCHNNTKFSAPSKYYLSNCDFYA